MLGSPGGSQWQVGSVRTSAAAAGAAAAAAAAGRTPAGRGRLGNRFPTCVRRAGQRARSGRGAPTPLCPGFHRTTGVSVSGVPAAVAATPVQVSRGGERREPVSGGRPDTRQKGLVVTGERYECSPKARGRERSPHGAARVPGGHSPDAAAPRGWAAGRELGGGEPRAGLLVQVEAARKAGASRGTFSEVVRAGWKAA